MENKGSGLSRAISVGTGRLRKFLVASVATVVMVAVYAVSSLLSYGLAVTGVSAVALTATTKPATAQRRRRNRGRNRGRSRGRNRGRGRRRGGRNAARVIGTIIRAIDNNDRRRRRSRRRRRR